MNILIAAICFVMIPSVCSAHSGTLINAFSNYFPFILPAVAGFFASFKNLFTNFFNRFRKK